MDVMLETELLFSDPGFRHANCTHIVTEEGFSSSFNEALVAHTTRG